MGTKATLQALRTAKMARDQQKQISEWEGDYLHKNGATPGLDLSVAPVAPQSPRKADPPATWPFPGSKPYVVLEAARELDQPFTLSSLVIRSWSLDKDLFGMEGCARLFPSEHKVRCCLWGKSGLIGRGLLRKVGNLFEVV